MSPSLARSIHPVAAATQARRRRRGLFVYEELKVSSQHVTRWSAKTLSSLTKSSCYITNSIYWLILQNKIAAPPNVDLTKLRFPQLWYLRMTLSLDVCLAVSKARLLVQTHKHTDGLQEFALRQNWLLWLIHRKHGDGKYWCWGRMPLRETCVCVCVCARARVRMHVHQCVSVCAHLWPLMFVCVCSIFVAKHNDVSVVC